MAQLQIKPVKKAAKGHNRYCGPAALSIISGIDTAQAAYLLRQIGNRRQITGANTADMLRALNRLGFNAFSVAKVNPLKPKDNPTLAAWLRSTTKTRGSKLYLIDAGHHWQVVQGRRYCCGIIGDVVSIKDDKVKRRSRVCGVWQIELNRFQPSADELAQLLTPPPKAPRDNARRKAMKLANQHGVEVAVERWGDPGERYDRIIVWGLTFKDEEAHDPHYGNHYAEDWADALERVEDYVKIKLEQPELLD